jgi:hypothetical protein
MVNAINHSIVSLAMVIKLKILNTNAMAWATVKAVAIINNFFQSFIV